MGLALSGCTGIFANLACQNQLCPNPNSVRSLPDCDCVCNLSSKCTPGTKPDAKCQTCIKDTPATPAGPIPTITTFPSNCVCEVNGLVQAHSSNRNLRDAMPKLGTEMTVIGNSGSSVCPFDSMCEGGTELRGTTHFRLQGVTVDCGGRPGDPCYGAAIPVVIYGDKTSNIVPDESINSLTSRLKALAMLRRSTIFNLSSQVSPFTTKLASLSQTNSSPDLRLMDAQTDTPPLDCRVLCADGSATPYCIELRVQTQYSAGVKAAVEKLMSPKISRIPHSEYMKWFEIDLDPCNRQDILSDGVILSNLGDSCTVEVGLARTGTQTSGFKIEVPQKLSTQQVNSQNESVLNFNNPIFAPSVKWSSIELEELFGGVIDELILNPKLALIRTPQTCYKFEY